MPTTSGVVRTCLLVLLGMLITTVVALGYAYRPEMLASLQQRLDDFVLRSIASGLHSDNVVIVDIDERSLQEFGQWPWPRNTLATLVEAIAAGKPRCIALDMLFAETDRIAATNDTLLAQSLAKAPVILGYQFLAQENKEHSADCLLLPLNLTLMTPPGIEKITLDLFTARSILCTLPSLAGTAASEGFLNVFPDSDGSIRTVPLLMGWRGKLYPNLALATALFVLHNPQMKLYLSPNGVECLELLQQNGTIDSVIPLDPYGQLTVNYRGKARTFPFVSAQDILHGNIGQTVLEEKIVFVGTSASELADLRTTPLGTNVPGVEIQATVADNLLQGDSLHGGNGFFSLELAAIYLVGLLTSFCVILLRPLWRLAYAVLCAYGLWAVAVFLADTRHFLFSPLYPSITLLAVCIVLSFFKGNTPSKDVSS